MTGFTPRDPNYEARIRQSFAKQHFMAFIGAELTAITPGAVDIGLPTRDDLTQQHGFLHAGTTITIADSAAGYAALSLFPAGFGVLTTELKVNLLNPAKGEWLIARGRVIKPGRTLTICRGDVHAVDDGQESHVATALMTMISREGLDD